MNGFNIMKRKKPNKIIMMTIYDSMLLLAETLFLILKIFYFICENIFMMFIPIKKKSVAGEVVLITGAGHGIGKELAIGYASLEATVVCWDINEETNNQTMNEIKMMGKDIVYAYRCNVADEKEIFKTAEKVRKEVGDITILINNAGIAIVKKFLNQSVEEIKKVIDTNLMSHYWMVQAFLPNMIERNYGHVVAISSMLAFIGARHGSVYCAAKSAVKAFMETIYDEVRTSYKENSIKFTTIYPTVVLTGLAKNLSLRFPIIMRSLTPQEAAASIIDAQRRNLVESSIPSHLLFILSLLRILPNKVLYCIVDFFYIDIDED